MLAQDRGYTHSWWGLPFAYQPHRALRHWGPSYSFHDAPPRRGRRIQGQDSFWPGCRAQWPRPGARPGHARRYPCRLRRGQSRRRRQIDDGYEPEKTIVATNNAIKQHKVFALVGAVGTPTSKAGQPIATAAKVPFIGLFTGAEFLRNPFNRYVVNIRSSYFQETESWIEHLTNDLGITRVAILY